jgi:hypothetical protein
MAFLSDFGLGERPTGTHRHPAHVSFTATEWRVIRLSAGDDQSTLRDRTVGPIGRLTRWLFGLEQPNRFADPRLEALRRFAVAHRVHGEGGSAHFREALLAAGYSQAHIDLVRATVGDGRAHASGGRLRAATMMMTLVALFGGLAIVARGFAAYSGDALIGGVLGALLVVIVAPLALAPARRSL